MTTRKTKAAATAEVVPAAETTIANRTPDVIAAEIRDIDEIARQHAVRSATDIGEKLIEAKALVDHGEWASWLKQNVNYSQSTANNFMRVAVEYKELNSQTLANLSYSQAVALLSVPSEEREAFVEENKASEMSTRELQAAIKAKQEAEKLLEDERERVKEEQLARELEEGQRIALYNQYQVELELRKKAESDLVIAQEEAKKTPSKTDAKTKTELRKAEKDLSESQQRISALETEMKAKEEELQTKVAEQIKEREQELAEQSRKREEESAKQISELQEQLRKNNNTAAIAVKLHFDSLVGNLKELISSVSTLENEELKKAVSSRIIALLDETKEKL